MKKTITFFIILCFALLSQAQVIKTANITTAGTLSSVASSYLSTVTNLTITGTIDARDFKTMRDNMPTLAILDISSVTITAYTGTAGTYYYNQSATYPTSQIPLYSFYNGDTYTGKNSLTSINLPTSVTSIGSNAFTNCNGLTEYLVGAINPNYSSLNGVLFDKNQTNLIIFPKGKQGSYTIPNSVTSISDDAFRNCKRLTEFIVTPANANYSSLNGVLFNKNQTTLIAYPLGVNQSTYAIPNSVNIIGGYAFLNCMALSSITIGSGVTTISTNAFSGCTGLTNITIPNGVNSIGDTSFSSCTGLTNVSIGSGVTSIGSQAFIYCSGLTSITIPDGVTLIGSTSFRYCTGLTNVTIGSGLTWIGDYAFYGCDHLTYIYAKPTIPATLEAFSTSTNIFTNVSKSTCILYVPVGSRSTYQTAVGWKDFTNIIDDSPTVSTTNPTKITNASASTGGIIKPVTSFPVTNRGVCWGTTVNPTIANNKTNNGDGTGTFTSSIAGLTPATTYHIRAYITSNNSTTYGSDLNFTTSAIVPASFSLSSPANGGWTNQTPLFQWATSTGAFSYNLYIDDVLKQANITTTSYQILSTEALSPGMHTWYVVSGDGYAVQSNETWSFRVDNTQPTAFSLVSPTDNSWTASLQPTLTWGASSDVNSSLAKYQLWIDGVLNRDNISTTTTTTTPTANLTNGSHTWEIRAIDNVRNVRNSTQKLTVKVDNMPPGKGVSKCLYFDGTGNYVLLNNSLHISNNFTIETWVNFSNGGSESPRIISKQNDAWGTPGEYSLYLDGNGASSKIVFWIGGVSTLASNTILNQNTWYHIAAIYSGNSTTSTMKIYVNGVLDISANTSGTLLNTTDNLTFGRKGAGTSYLDKFKGSIDEVRIWNTVRTAQEINGNKDNIIDPNTLGLIGYWRFNEGSGSLIMDNSINNYTATNYGAQYQSSNLVASSSLCNLKSPLSNQYISSKTPTFSWNKALDTGIGFDKFQLFIDGNMTKDNLSDSTWTVTTPLTYGVHTWYVKGFDLLGNNQSSYSRTFYIDNSRPNAFNLTSPTNNQIVNLPTPNLTWQSTTDSTGGSGLRKYQLLINGIVNRDSIPIAQTTVAPKNALAQGSYNWTVKVYDNVGNVRQSTQTNTFYVDWENPTDFTLITPLDNSTLTVSKPEFKWHKSTDVGSGISKYELNISGQTPINTLPSDTSKLITTNLPNGPYTWYVKAYDVAGGFTSSNTQTFTINTSVSGVEQTEMNSSIKVYPNPVVNELVIESDKNERTNFEIINSIGQVIYKGILLDKTVFQTSGFNSGIYIVKLENGKTYEFKKILKK